MCVFVRVPLLTKQVALADGNYCVWLAQNNVFPEFTAYVCQVDWVPWPVWEKEAFAAIVAPLVPPGIVARETPFLFRDSLLQVFQHRGTSSRAGASQLSDLESTRGKNIFVEARHEEMLIPRPFSRSGNYLDWVISTSREATENKALLQFAAYLKVKQKIDHREKVELERQYALQRQAQEEERKKRQRGRGSRKKPRRDHYPLPPIELVQVSTDVIACKCGKNFDDKESLYVACDVCNTWSHARCFFRSFANFPKHFVCDQCQSALETMLQ